MTRIRVRKSLAAFPIATAMFTAILCCPAAAALEISARPTRNVTCSAGVCQATAATARLNVTELASMLSAGDVSVVSGSVGHDIEVNAALSWSSASRLTLDSYFSLAVNAPIVVAGTGSLTITTSDGALHGEYRFFNKGHVEFRDLASGLTINGEDYVLVNRLGKLARDILNNPGRNYALAKSINAGHDLYSSSPVPLFIKKFEGLGNRIANLTIDAGSSPKTGLFGQLSGQAVVRDVGLTDVNITGAGEKAIGALVGFLYSSSVQYAYATGTVSGTGIAPVGGLVGLSTFGLIQGSRADVSVSASGNASAAGGLVGSYDGATNIAIDRSYATGTVSAGAGANVGGLAGINTGEILNSYATGTVTGGDGARVGGLVGQDADGEFSKPVLFGAYSIGAVSGGSGATVGGLIGEEVADSRLMNTYWDLDTSGVSDPHKGAGNVADQEGITGLTSDQFKAGLPSGFTPLAWAEKATRNNGYPYLIANPPP